MLTKNYTAKLLNLEDVIITNVENISCERHVCIELPRSKHRCPACSALTDRIHDYRMQTIKDVPPGRTTVLHLRKRRYRCACGKRFFEKNTFLPRYYRATGRLIATIISAFRETVSAQKIGTQYHVSGATAVRYFNASASILPSFRRFSRWMNSRETPAAGSTTASLRMPKSIGSLTFCPIASKTTSSNISHNFYLKIR